MKTIIKKLLSHRLKFLLLKGSAQKEFEDVGWGCGWRNIQMLTSHLLFQRPQEANHSSLADLASSPTSPHSKRGLKLHGTKDLIHLGQITLIARYLGNALGLVPLSALHFSVLVTKSGGNRVIVTQKAPLYFHHDGHSRTIVGIQLKRLPNGTNQHNLLIFDPAHKTQVLESCLSKKFGWQRYIKRGVHTLKKTEYQLCYIDPGIATGAEMQKLKTLDSTHFEF